MNVDTKYSESVFCITSLLMYVYDLFVDTEPPLVEHCPDDVNLPTRFTDQAAYTWAPSVFSDNSGQSVDVGFGCSATVSNECQEDGNGHFSVGVTEVMYNGTKHFAHSHPVSVSKQISESYESSEPRFQLSVELEFFFS